MASETFYKSMFITCEFDGIVRSVQVKCYRFDGSFAADTFFSVPANTRVRGKYVHGFIMSENGQLQFCAHTACKPLLVSE